MGFLLTKLVPLVLYPLGLALLLQIGGLLARRRRWGPWLSAVGIALLAVASMPWVSRQLLWQLEEPAARLTPSTLPQADAVLVLGGGLQPALPPRRDVEVNGAGDRLLTGVQLVKTDLAPWLLVSGGRVTFRAEDPSPPEAEAAQRLARRLGVPAGRILLLDTPRNTAEEARALEKLARARGWRSVLLVTSASHMLRSLSTFRRLTDLRIVPVACDFRLPERRRLGRPTAASVLIDLLPSADALAVTTGATREHLGQWFYRLRGWM